LAAKHHSGFHIAWTTISYRSVAMFLVLLVLIAATAAYFLLPAWGPVLVAIDYAGRITDTLGFGTLGKRTGVAGLQQAHFTALEGTVRVKKANSNTWVNADFSLPLDKGDVVQTSSEGIAKLVFSDGTSYSLKPDSLIVVEENSTNSQQQTQVAVQVTTGTVDLSTGTYSQGSSSQVIVAGAKAALAPESAAVVHNDPRADKHQILLKKGSGRITRNNETVTLSDYEMVSFKADAPKMTRTREISPPTLISPAQAMPVFVPVLGKPIDFSWTPSGDIRRYRVRVSQNPYFSSTVFDRVVQGTEVKIPGLKDGTYYWVVTSQDVAGKESVESERNQFTVVLRSNDAGTVALELEPLVQHGHVIHIRGKTDPGARVMVNGHEVPLVRPDGGFSFFTPPLPSGENTITVTAQNLKGGVKTYQKKLVIE
jgi:hypothetical protein